MFKGLNVVGPTAHEVVFMLLSVNASWDICKGDPRHKSELT